RGALTDERHQARKNSANISAGAGLAAGRLSLSNSLKATGQSEPQRDQRRPGCRSRRRADVDRLLGGGVRRLWLVSIFDVYRFQQPGNADWEQKMALRQQLDAAVSELRRQEREARRAAKAIPEPAREPEPAPAG